MNTINFNGFTCTVNITKYTDGNTAILLEDSTDGSPIAVASVNIPEEKIQDGHLFIKDWSENEGILAALENAGIVKDTGITYPCGYCTANLCKIV